MCVWQRGSQKSSRRYDQWKKHYLTFNTVLFHSIIPSIILLIVNWLILCSLSRQRDILSKIGSIDAKNVLKREKQFKEKIIQLVLSSFFVIITISPRYILTMVNAFATNLSKTPLMPLYIYVNLNTVFRVLEMANYSLNIIFAILSGRTSRLEIRKILWECLFWRFKRTQSDRSTMKYPAHTFLFTDEDDDTDRSVQVQSAVPCPGLNVHQNKLSSKLSNASYSLQLSQTSTSSAVFNCCGFSIDLSNKNSHVSNSKSLFDESLKRRSISNKNPQHVLVKTASCPQSKTCSPNNCVLRPQNTVCYRSTNVYRPVSRRRAATLMHGRRDTPASIKTTLTTTVYPSISNDNQCLSFENQPPIIDMPPPSKDGCKTSFLPSELLHVPQTDCDGPVLPAYIIETC
ncbi:unnamed protein product [Adineta ricciae]|uniref:G-protein coupled receptors family 1 profile domain-containing protein n=1 Tax=Adineta ricciae TaxID=249248 RepID=A0A813Q286_ADIRI|nr:unnamed protein product [Adineta ricciae]CAF0897165.1 unnamed protein product [Adineta ricciae]